MRYNLAEMAQRARRPNVKAKTLRAVVVPATLATTLYRTFYLPALLEWERQAKRIERAYEQALDELQRDDARDIGDVVDDAEREIEALAVTLKPALDRWASLVERVQRSKWAGAVLTATGVNIETLIGPEDARNTVEVAVRRNVDLVSNVSRQTRTRIAQAVFQGYTARRAPRDIAKQIRDATGMARTRALNIAADQNVKLASALNEERRRQAGVTKWEWVHSGKVHFRPEHLARDGKLFSDDDPPEDMPGELPYCGCTSRAVVEFDEPRSELPQSERTSSVVNARFR